METNIYSTELPSHRDSFYEVKQIDGLAVRLDLDNGEQVWGRNFEDKENEVYFEIKDMCGEKRLVPRNRIVGICNTYRYWVIIDDGVAKVGFVLPSHIKVKKYGLPKAVHVEDAGGFQAKLSTLARIQTEIV
ncbi:hypothetical protein [Aliivibrio fischeri]|uniref:hypothetical protein n=1 Tax=Aliivibrio fischeri TaxID=668 RepID=UPI0007C49704|nr:hypothetical protein [Aliivibrio fischeri]